MVVAIITGNGLKTLEDHPEKPWPSMVECESESMLSVLSDFQHEQAASAGVSRCPVLAQMPASCAPSLTRPPCSASQLAGGGRVGEDQRMACRDTSRPGSSGRGLRRRLSASRLSGP